MQQTSPSKSFIGEILIVEDSATQALRLRHTLVTHGFAVTTAGNGQEALDALEHCAPKLIISDVQMPVMDGYEFCRRIKADPARQEIPVMLLTALSAPQDIIRGLECGADNFVVKPYEEKFLMARIRTVLANCTLRQMTGDARGIAVEFAGQRYVIDASRRQILNLLLSTYETAVKTNDDLTQAHEELKSAQAQLIEAEKLQSVGRLAAGVAHEVRNPLAIMEMGVAFLSSQEIPDEHRLILKEMEEAVHRANVVVTSLMDLSPRDLGMRAADIHEVVNRALVALEDRLTRGKIAVVREFDASVPPLKFDADKMVQVFMNVFSNALQAMTEGGQLTVRSGVKTIRAEDAAYDAGDRSGVRFREGERVITLEVDDTGSGIAREHLGKIFEPFFSTKPTGQGMGLGLTVARKLVELHHGSMAIGNRREGGARVTMIFKMA